MTRDDHVRVRPAEPSDAPFLQRLRTHPATAEYLAGSSRTEAELHAELATPIPHGGRLNATSHDGEPLAALKWTLVNRRSRIAELAEVIVVPSTAASASERPPRGPPGDG